MDVVCIIPARYESSRLPGKPLRDICGRPMIWWTYKRVSKIDDFKMILVATDDERIEKECKKYDIPCIMTGLHKTHIDRIHEVSKKIHSDYYLCVCGDEPLIQTETIKAALPSEKEMAGPSINVLMRELTEPTEVIDPANIKIATNGENECVMLSRSPIPFPYKTLLYKYKKIIGVECYNKEALDLFSSTEQGPIEKIEDITLLRFLEKHVKIKFHMVESDALSVDTEKDLDKVRKLISQEMADSHMSIE